MRVQACVGGLTCVLAALGFHAAPPPPRAPAPAVEPEPDELVDPPEGAWWSAEGLRAAFLRFGHGGGEEERPEPSPYAPAALAAPADRSHLRWKLVVGVRHMGH